MTQQTQQTKTENKTINALMDNGNPFIVALTQKVNVAIKEGIAKATKKADFQNINIEYENLQNKEILALLHSDRVAKVTHTPSEEKTKLTLDRTTAIYFIEGLAKLPAGSVENALSQIVAIAEKEIRYFFLFAFENEVKTVIKEEKNEILKTLTA